MSHICFAAVSIITTLSLGALALAWGLCNYGFITYVPTMLVTVGKSSIEDTIIRRKIED
jgi:hypothetical protein